MPTPLQPFVSNVPLTLAANLRFKDANGLWVTQLLPVGMNGLTVADSPTTGYISRIGAVLSQQIDLYNQVNQTLQNYAQDISDLQQAVNALEISGTTIPVVNGFCFSGNANILITDLIELMAESDCEYIPVLGSPTSLIEAIEAEGATTLNIMPSYSIAGGQMQALSGWDPSPETIASSINNLWLAYLDSRAALTYMQKFITPSCSNNIVDFAVATNISGTTNPNISIYFSGYSFITSAYSDNGSTITITDGVGGVYRTAINLVTRSQPGADPLFVGISGTPLSPLVSCYNITLNSILTSNTNSCTKTVIHSTCQSSSSTGSSCPYRAGYFSVSSFNTPLVIAKGLPFIADFANIVALDAGTSTIIQQGYYININSSTGDITVTFTAGQGSNLNIKWAAFKNPI